MIRDAATADILRLVELGQAMHAESRYAARPWNPRKVCGLMDWLIANEDGLLLVATDEAGEILGGFLGMVQDDWATDVRVATDFALYVAPGRRGSLAAGRLLKAYREWAQGRGAIVTCGITTGIEGIDPARLYRAMGFEPVGTLFEFKES